MAVLSGRRSNQGLHGVLLLVHGPDEQGSDDAPQVEPDANRGHETEKNPLTVQRGVGVGYGVMADLRVTVACRRACCLQAQQAIPLAQ